MVGLLASALRIEVRLVQDDRFALDGKDLRAEGTLPLVLVHAELRRRQVPQYVDLLRRFRGGRPVVAGRHPRVEVIRDFDGHVREFAHDVRIETVAII